VGDSPKNAGQTWFTEYHTEGSGLTLKVKEQLARKQSPYQLIEVFETVEFGNLLTLDGLVMITERDEHVYHEMMTHVPMLAHPAPKRVLVVGGGDGGCLREIVRHPQLEKVTQVEIDGDVVDLCKKYFPDVAQAYKHPKVELVIGDAIDYLRRYKGEFDVAIIDGSDPVGPAVGLFDRSFFEDVFDALKSGGLMSCQIGSPLYSLDRIASTLKHWRSIFAEARPYLAHIPTYPSGVWSLGLASKEPGGTSVKPDEVRFRTISNALKYYNLDIHRGSFALPSEIARAIV
jgi:spermidine synthase